MASSALQFRLQEAERQLAALKEGADQLQEQAARLEEKIDALRRSLDREQSESAPASSSTAAPRPVTPPPLPPQKAPAAAPHPAPKASIRPTQPLPERAVAPQAPVPRSPVLAPSEPSPSPQEPREGLELQLGRVWFVRIGIGLLLTGFVFLSTYAYQNFIVNWSAGSRVATLYTAAILLTAAGFLLERWKETLLNYGRVVGAGGFAAIYYTTYATHHVERLRVIDSPVLAAVLLSLAALAFFAYAASKKSSVLTVGALVLAFYATAINPMGWLGCFSGLLLSAIGMFFFLHFRWLKTGVASLIGAYLSYAYWQGFVNPEAVADPTRWFLAGYWLLFTAGVLAPQARQQKRDFLVGFASANNALFFFLFSFQFQSLTWVPDLWLNALVFGTVLLAIAFALGRRRDYPPLLGQVFLATGLALMTWSFSLKLTGHQLFLTLTIEALVLAFLWRGTHSPIYRAFVWIPAALAGGIALWTLLPHSEAAPPFAYLIQGFLFVALAILMRGAPYLDAVKKEFSCEATAASLLALAIPTIALNLTLHTPAAERGLWMVCTGLVLWLVYLIRPERWPLPELVWLAQPYAVLGALLTLANHATLPQLSLLAGAGALAFLAHGFAFDRKRPTSRPEASQIFELAFTVISLTALGLLIHRGIDDPGHRLLLFTALPLAGHFCGTFLSRPGLAGFSQLFYVATLALSAFAWEPANLISAPSQSTALLALLIVLVHLVTIHFVPRLNFRESFRETHLVVASVLWAGWCVSFIDPWWLVLAWTGCALFFLPARFRAKLHPAIYLSFLVIGVASLCLFESGQFWLRYLALPAAFIVHLMQSRRDPEARETNQPLWAGLATLSVVALALIASQHTLDAFDGKGLSICWALLGLACFGLGLTTKVRVYRFGGLALLALSLGHVLAVDVWKLETVLRIFSFLTLGLVLLALGFVYNRWHEAIRKLL